MRSSKTKHELDTHVALRTGHPKKLVRDITAAFTEVMAEVLLRHHVLHIDNLGRLSINTVNVNRKVRLTTGKFKKGSNGGTREVEVKQNIRVYFSKSSHFRKRLEETYGKARSSRGR